MKRSVLLAVLVILSVSLFNCGGGGGSTPSSVTVTLFPVDGATYKLLGTAVTATFSAAITAPSDWSNIFTLKKNNIGDTLCTSVTLSEDALTATCVHDELDFASSYTVAMTGLSGATDPTPATFQTSNLFAGFSANKGDHFIIAIDEPSVGKVTVRCPEESEESEVFDYTIDPTDPTLITVDDTPIARIAGSFAVFSSEGTNIVPCLLIDPNQTDMNFNLDKTYGGLGLATQEAPSYAVVYYTEPIDAAGSASMRSNIDISDTPAFPFDFLLSSYTLDPANYDFLLTQSPIDLSTYVNADGYNISKVRYDGSYLNLLIGNEDRADGTIPAEIAVGDVYKGYIYSIPDVANTLELRVTAIEGSSISAGVSFGSETEEIFSFSNVTDPAEWGTGFYKNVHENKTIVIRILNQNAILFTYSDPEHSDYNLALVIK